MRNDDVVQPGEPGSGWRRSPLFSHLSPEQAEALRQRMRLEVFEPRRRLFAQGEAGDRVYVVDKGAVKISLERDGQSALAQVVLGPGDVVGLYPSLGPGPRDSTAVAASEVVTASILCAELEQCHQERAAINFGLAQQLCQRLFEFDVQRVDLLMLDTAGRLAKLLVQLARRFGAAENGTIRVQLALSQKELGELIGVSRDTAGARLREFAERGWIAKAPGVLHILAPEELARRAGPSKSIVD
ncbi:Crp/Fnr family transcriptional regulator [Crossiella sp. CA-258035]|uniref:Crp/Fnr family transcriptional regulator n=1 Tax=Crossiella sp. CA-258035 TaxID=2981138 RepID=UPI0024BC1D0B|nr:Crp/Fnr family transcriptional regulator [Crossiella sp. CA-258035]WHT22531.1 Crp/Fnr family transcriptional regulator [Crossiella sp. CA-258035]